MPTTKEPIEKMYEQFKLMIMERGHHFSRILPHERDDIQAQANLIFVETYERWDPDRASFSTYLYTRLTLLLNEYIKNECNILNNEDEPINDDEQVSGYLIDPERAEILKEELSGLGPDTKKILDLIFNHSDRILKIHPRHKDGSVWGMKITRYLIKKYLKGLGWKGPKIERSFLEIKMALNSI